MSLTTTWMDWDDSHGRVDVREVDGSASHGIHCSCAGKNIESSTWVCLLLWTTSEISGWVKIESARRASGSLRSGKPV